MLKVRVFLDGKEIKEKDKEKFVIVNSNINKILESVLDAEEEIEKTA